MQNPLRQLTALGQSIWYDNISRKLLEAGDIARMIDHDNLTGLTSNPSIFEKAIGQSQDYDQSINTILQQNPDIDTKSLFEQLAIPDIQAATDLMRPIYDRTGGDDGYVSLEVSPTLANDTNGSIEEGERLFAAVDRPNLMIKIPATPAGLPAISALIGQGINVNVTLMFSLQHYDDVAEAYLQGLETLAKDRDDLSGVASVASFFVSRVDTSFDEALEANGSPKALALRGKVAIANAKAAYKRFQTVFGSDRFKALAARGARVQRPLWASTSTKNPDYRDVLYVEELIGPDTVNTMPPATIDAFRDHGVAEARLTHNMDDAAQTLEQIKALGIDYTQLTEELQVKGVDAFAKSFQSLMDTLAEKQAAIQVNA